MPRYQVISPIKFAGKTIREGDVEMPAKLGNQHVTSGHLVELKESAAEKKVREKAEAEVVAAAKAEADALAKAEADAKA